MSVRHTALQTLKLDPKKVKELPFGTVEGNSDLPFVVTKLFKARVVKICIFLHPFLNILLV